MSLLSSFGYKLRLKLDPKVSSPVCSYQREQQHEMTGFIVALLSGCLLSCKMLMRITRNSFRTSTNFTIWSWILICWWTFCSTLGSERCWFSSNDSRLLFVYWEGPISSVGYSFLHFFPWLTLAPGSYLNVWLNGPTCSHGLWGSVLLSQNRVAISPFLSSWRMSCSCLRSIDH